MPTIPYIRDLRNQTRKKTKHLTTSEKIYNRQKWKKLRDAYIAEHPLCERCLEKGKITAAEQVHHVRPFLSGMSAQEIESLAYDHDNLMALCSQCHKEIHQEMGGYGNYSNF